jgi:hypothetical protein
MKLSASRYQLPPLGVNNAEDSQDMLFHRWHRATVAVASYTAAKDTRCPASHAGAHTIPISHNLPNPQIAER